MKLTVHLVKLWLASSLVLTFLVGKSQTRSEVEGQTLFGVENTREDYLILRKALETTYPSLYRFSDSVIITSYLDDQFASLKSPMTEIEFYRMVTLTCAKVNDEHLIPTPSEKYFHSLKATGHFFPFSLKIIDRRIFIFKSFDLQSQLPIGTEVLSINGHSAEEILNILLPTIPSDGYIQTFNLRHLEDYSMTQNRNLFDLNYPIFVEQKDSFTIEFIRQDLKTQKQIITIPSLSFKDYQTFYKKRIGYKAPLEFRYVGDQMAYLKISSFLKYHRDDFKQDFVRLYDSIFNQLNLKGTRNLILDLRNNEGGDGTGEMLLTYLMIKPYRHFDYTDEKFVGYPAVVDYLENGKDLLFIDSIVFKTAAGMFRLKKEYYKYLPLLNEQSPAKNNYKGKLYVLVNGASGSMASVVSSFLRGNQRAIFIGEETGGTMEGNTSLSYASLMLPNTKIKIEIPLTKTVHHVDFIKGRGVFPDYCIDPKIEDIMKGTDTELDFTLNLINGRGR